MTTIAAELDHRLQQLDPVTAASVERLVRDALQLAETRKTAGATLPDNFWQQIRSDWGTEPFERPPQGEFEKREEW